MDVLETAAVMGLTGHAGDDVLGTIEEDVVLSALTELAAGHPGLDDLFDEADARVRQARSAGLDRMDPDSVFARRHAGSEIQLRYRADMLDVFIDLAIDVGLRAHRPEVAQIAS